MKTFLKSVSLVEQFLMDGNKNFLGYYVIVCFLYLFFRTNLAETKCFIATGKLICKNDTEKAMDCDIRLMDKDCKHQ